jgi:DNA-binding NtrC family response regulator
MTSVWIIHRDPPVRAAIARLAAVSGALSGAPSDPVFESEPPADVVLLGLSGDLEAELHFVHRCAPRQPGAHWILLGERSAVQLARPLFDTLEAEYLVYPPDARTLRAHIRSGRSVRSSRPLPLSQRPSRDALSERFTRWFSDFHSPELLRALDPHLAAVPLMIEGEIGSGRGLLARYIHSFGGTSVGVLAHVPCTAATSGDRVLAIVAAASRQERGSAACTILLEDLDRLSLEAQLQVRRWIEFGVPEGVLRTDRSRWIATADASRFEGATLEGEIFDPGLRVAMSGLCIRIPPLRERPSLLARFANETARAWCRARGERPRRIGEDAVQVLEEYPWPGNLRELESVVEQTLATGGSDPVRADDLQHEGTAFAPIDASEIGVLLSEDEELDFQSEPPPAVVTPTVPTTPKPDPELQPALRPEEAIAAEPPPKAEPPSKAEPERSPEPPTLPARSDGDMKRLVGAVAHEVRNPLTAIRSFAQLLPERYQDPEFRDRFSALVGQGVERIERVVEHLDRLGSLGAARSIPADITKIVSGVLEGRRDRIRQRHLLVLEELESTHPRALTDPDLLRAVLESVFDKVLELVPERGDVYVASRHHPADARGAATLRVLVRFGGGGRGARPGLSPADNALEFAVAECILSALAGRFNADTSETGETRLLIDLPAA